MKSKSKRIRACLNNNKQGFTLIELLVVIALMAIISVPLSASLIFGVKIFGTESVVDKVFQDQQSAFVYMKETLRNDPYNVKLEIVGSSEHLIVGVLPETAKHFFLKDAELILQTGALTSSQRILCDNVVDFTISNTLVDTQNLLTELNITLKSEVKGRDHTLSSSFSLRRY